MMNIRSFSLPAVPPPFELVLSRLGYRHEQSQSDLAALDAVRREMELCRPVTRAVGHSLDLAITGKTAGTVTLENGLTLPSEKVSRLLEPCDKLTLLLCTVGAEVEEESRRLMDAGELARGVIWDAVGSEAVEAFIEYINEVLAQEHALTRYRPTRRFSPGYGDLPTSVHAQWLPLLDAESLGISFHPESYLLIPQKSVSALIGWYRS